MAAALPSGRTSATTLLDADRPRDRLRRPTVVARQHHHVEPEATQARRRPPPRSALSVSAIAENGRPAGRRRPRTPASCRPAASASAAASRAPGDPCAARWSARPTRTRRPSTSADDTLARRRLSKASAAWIVRPRVSRPRARSRRRAGCSEPRSAAAASARISSSCGRVGQSDDIGDGRTALGDACPSCRARPSARRRAARAPRRRGTGCRPPRPCPCRP